MNPLARSVGIGILLLGMAINGSASNTFVQVTDLHYNFKTYDAILVRAVEVPLCFNFEGFDPRVSNPISVFDNIPFHYRQADERIIENEEGKWMVEYACGYDVSIPGMNTNTKALMFYYYLGPAS